MATTTATPKIVGKALYLELIADPALSEDDKRSLLGWNTNGAKQIIIFPQYQDDTGKVYDPILMSRVVSSHTPRSQWDIHRVGGRYPKPVTQSQIEAQEDTSTYYRSYVTFEYYSTSEWDSLTEREKYESRKFALNMTLRQQTIDTMYEGEGDERKIVAKQGWIVRESKPIVVEVTDQDMSEAIAHKTPQAVIRRINKVRDTLDKFPKKLA